MTVEPAPEDKRGFYGTWPQVGPSAGTLLATGAFAAFNTLPEDQFMAWGWRMPFLLSAVVVTSASSCGSSCASRRSSSRSRKPERAERAPIVQAFRDHRREIFLIAGMRLAINTTFYMATVFALSYGIDQLGIPKGAAAGDGDGHRRARLRQQAALRRALGPRSGGARSTSRLARRRARGVPVLRARSRPSRCG